MDDVDDALRNHVDLTRRALLGGSLALGGAAFVAGSSLRVSASEDIRTPKAGGSVRLGLSGCATTDSLNPLKATDTGPTVVNFGIYNGLVENGPKNESIPELAESWEARGDAKIWIFNLRSGIHFHNGKEFNAEDAVYSLNLHRGKSSSAAAGQMKSVVDVAKVSEHQIQVTLDSANAEFPALMTDYHILMVPNGFTDWSNPIGTGAFKVESFQPGIRTVLVKAGPYWKPERGHLDRVEIVAISDSIARVTALITGAVDVVNSVDPKLVSRISSMPKFEVVRSPAGWFPTMSMQTDAAPFDNVELRKALKYGLNRERMVSTLFSGFGIVGNDNPVSKNDRFFNTDLLQTTFDPDKAKFHLKKSGLDNAKIILHASDGCFNGAVNMGLLMQESAASCGIPLDVKREPADGYFSNTWMNVPFFVGYWGMRPTETQRLEIAFQSQAPWNESHWHNDHFDALLAQAKAELDPEKRKSPLWEIQSMLTDIGGSLVPCFADWIDACSGKIGGLTPHSQYSLDNARVLEKIFLTT